jgi:death-on-curing protein
LVGNHSLVDGNKRLGRLATVVFYGLNDVLLDAPDDAAYEPVMVVWLRGTSTSSTSRRLSGRGTEFASTLLNP